MFGHTPPTRMRTNLTTGQDYPYLTPIIEEIEAEMQERHDLEEMVVAKRKAKKEAASTTH